MLSKATIERITGILLLLIVPATVAAVLADPGVDTRSDEFRGSLQDLADSEVQNWVAAGFGFVMSGLFVAAGAALYVTFRAHDRLLSLLGAFGLLAAGVSFTASIVAGLALNDLADEFGSAQGVQADQIIPAARALAIVSDLSLFAGLAFFGLALTAVGILTIWREPMPRWLGWLAAVGGILIPVGLPTFFLALLGLLMGLVWLAVAGGQLVWRGTAEPGATG